MGNPYIFTIQGITEKAKGVHYDVDLSQNPIGEGGMGKVYRGLMVNDKSGVKQEVAIKFLREDLPTSMIARCEREASIRIKNDNLVEMIDFVRIDFPDQAGNNVTRLHVVSELLQGVMLYDLIEKHQIVDVYGNEVAYAKELLQKYRKDCNSFAVAIGKKILSGIMALHDAGYIHRDIDPSNIMITHDRKIKLIDFGIARAFNNLRDEKQTTIAGNFVGKPAYAAPELVLGDIQHQNETTDIYALGILLFQLATGHLPFEGPAQDVLDMQRNKPMPLDKISNDALRHVIDIATQKSQSKRFQTAAEFRVALEQMKSDIDSQELPNFGAIIDEKPSGTIIDESSTGTIIDRHTGKPISIPMPDSDTPGEGTLFLGQETSDNNVAETKILSNGLQGESDNALSDNAMITYLPWVMATLLGLLIGGLTGWFIEI